MKSVATIAGMILTLGMGCGCVAPPYAHRDYDFNRGQYEPVTREAYADMNIFGQFDVDGRVEGKAIVSARHVFDTTYPDLAEEAHRILPLVYYDLARVSLGIGRYLDAVHFAKLSISEGNVYFKQDQWTCLRMLNLLENHRILYESYLNLGDLQLAAAHHKQFVILFDLVTSKPFKNVAANTVLIRLTSMRLRSDYLCKQNWATVPQILIAVATVAAASQQRDSRSDLNIVRTIALGALLVAMIEEYKQEVSIQHGVDLKALLDRAAILNRLAPPTAEDIRRAKMASSLYYQARARDPSSPIDTTALDDLNNLVDDCIAGIVIELDSRGMARVKGNLATLIAASRHIDDIPLHLPPLPADSTEAYLNKYLTPNLYRMAGLRMTAEESAYFDKLLQRPGQEYTFNLSDEKGRAALNSIRKMMQKSKECEIWLAEL